MCDKAHTRYLQFYPRVHRVQQREDNMQSSTTLYPSNRAKRIRGKDTRPSVFGLKS